MNDDFYKYLNFLKSECKINFKIFKDVCTQLKILKELPVGRTLTLKGIISKQKYDLLFIKFFNLDIVGYEELIKQASLYSDITIDEFKLNAKFKFLKIGHCAYAVSDLSMGLYELLKFFSKDFVLYFVSNDILIKAIQSIFSSQLRDFSKQISVSSEFNKDLDKISVGAVSSKMLIPLTLLFFIFLILLCDVTFSLISFVFIFLFCIRFFLFSYALLHNKKDKFCKNVKIKKKVICTVLLPIDDYSRQHVLQLFEAVKEIKYPKYLLDVKIIVEESNVYLVNFLKELSLPYYFEIIIVPTFLPISKPKACRYALAFSFGSIITIYDIESIPSKFQILNALKEFNELDVVQYKLEIYNKSKIISLLSSYDYEFWFTYVLKPLNDLNCPMPLCGNSNFFKSDVFDRIGSWDSFNVTEDFEIGLRLYLFNCKTKFSIESSYKTIEEAPDTVLNWVFQRSRWTKGQLVTFIVYFFNFIFFLKHCDKRKLFMTYFIALLMFFIPIFQFVVIVKLIFCLCFSFTIITVDFYLMTFLYFMLTIIFFAIEVKKKNLSFVNSIFIAPLYVLYSCLFYSLSSCIAIFDCFKDVSFWYKTKHRVVLRKLKK